MTETAWPPGAPPIDETAYQRRWLVLALMCTSLVLVVAMIPAESMTKSVEFSSANTARIRWSRPWRSG